jgi:hypothetical protein
MYWDGQTEPAVESPLGDFFAVGHGLNRNLNSAPVAITSEGRAYNCYWPMPFGKSARIEVTNDSDIPTMALFWYVDYEELPSLPANTPNFHAQYRQEYPCKKGEDYLLLDAVGEGYYVGTVLSMRVMQPGWFGEGDDRFFIDGAAEPQLRGTGTEDYFCDAWGFRESNMPYYGISVWEGYDAGHRGTAYRWHMTDPIQFKKSLRVTIEHKGSLYDFAQKKHTTGFGERIDDEFASVAFWYQTGVAKRYATVPPGPERLPVIKTIELENGFGTLFQESETVKTQEGASWSGNKHVLFVNSDPAAQLEVPFHVDQDMTALVRLIATRSYDYGIYDVYLDDALVLANRDFYNKDVARDEVVLGRYELKAGRHVLKLVCKGANGAARNSISGQPAYLAGVDAVTLSPLSH